MSTMITEGDQRKGRSAYIENPNRYLDREYVACKGWLQHDFVLFGDVMLQETVLTRIGLQFVGSYRFLLIDTLRSSNSCCSHV